MKEIRLELLKIILQNNLSIKDYQQESHQDQDNQEELMDIFLRVKSLNSTSKRLNKRKTNDQVH